MILLHTKRNIKYYENDLDDKNRTLIKIYYKRRYIVNVSSGQYWKYEVNFDNHTCEYLYSLCTSFKYVDFLSDDTSKKQYVV